jgi:hypothetical protein
MQLHTRLSFCQVYDALNAAKDSGKITHDIEFTVLDVYRSRTHIRAYKFHLGTRDKTSLPEGYIDQNGRKMRVRRYSNSGTEGASSVWGATWHEWGWFMLEVFKLDPGARFGGTTGHGYRNLEDFHVKTKNAFR